MRRDRSNLIFRHSAAHHDRRNIWAGHGFPVPHCEFPDTHREPRTPTASPPTPTASSQTLAASSTSNQGSVAVTEPVSRSQAEQIALGAVGSGQVTWSGPEDDRGAAWEVEITRPDGSEVDVLVAADGRVVKKIEKYGQGPVLEGPGTTPSTGAVTREQAEQAALDAVGEGRVTWSGPEDDRGAAWEIEITRPDGSEVDVLVAPDGGIIN